MSFASKGYVDGKIRAVDSKYMSLITSGTHRVGNWYADTNTPTLSPSSGPSGYWYDVASEGDWDGRHWRIGDRIIFNGATNKWDQVPTGVEKDDEPMIIGFIDETSTLPTTRPSGKPLLVGDYLKIDSSAHLPFEINDGTGIFIKIDSYLDQLEWNGTKFQEKSYSAGETTEITVNDPTVESIKGKADYQSKINIEFVERYKDIFKDTTYEDLDTLTDESKILKRIYRQTKDTAKRKAGLYWYNFNSPEPDKWTNLGGADDSLNFRGSFANWTDVPVDETKYAPDDKGLTTPLSKDYMVVQDVKDYHGEDIFTRDAEEVGKALDADGNLVDKSDFCVSDKLVLVYRNSKHIELKIKSGSGYTIRVHCYDADDKWISQVILASIPTGHDEIEVSADIPENVAYFKVSYPATATITSLYTYEMVGTWRFKYSGKWEDVGKDGWMPEYQINETPLTMAQLNALNSGITAELVEKLKDKPYLSLKRLSKYLYEITFDTIHPHKDIDATTMGACSVWMKDGKMYRNYDWKYNHLAVFKTITKDFVGIANIDGLDDGVLNDDLLSQLPYHIKDGVNTTTGIMVATLVLNNDFAFDGTGDKSKSLAELPYFILTNVKKISELESTITDYLSNLKIPKRYSDEGVIAHFMVSDGVTHYNITPKTDGSGYEVIDITDIPKLANFKHIDEDIVDRTHPDIQARPNGIERYNLIDRTTELKDLKYTNTYIAPDWLSEFIGMKGTDKTATDSELLDIYNEVKPYYDIRIRDGLTWQTVYSVVYSNKGIEHLYSQENYDIDYGNIDYKEIVLYTEYKELNTNAKSIIEGINENKKRLDESGASAKKVYGYLNPADGRFYEEKTFITEITPNELDTYVDITVAAIWKPYVWDKDNNVYRGIGSGQGVGSATLTYKTQDQYDALPESAKQDGTIGYFVEDITKGSEAIVAELLYPEISKTLSVNIISTSSKEIDGYEVPVLSNDQIVEAYNAFNANKEVYIIDNTGNDKLKVNDISVNGYSPIVRVFYKDKAIITYEPDTTEPIITVSPLGGGDSTPIGFVGYFSSNIAPKGYLICDGSEISRTFYKELFSVIGTTYGAGDGSTTFNVPNLIDKFPQGSKTVGADKEAGLPNITGTLAAYTYNNSSPTGAFTVNNLNPNQAPAGGATDRNFVRWDFNASRSSNVYGKSTTVQPPALTLLPCIKAVNVSNVSSTDIDGIAALVMDTLTVNIISTSSKEIDGYEVPVLTNDQILEAYTAFNANKEVYIVDKTGMNKFKVDNISSAGYSPIVRVFYEDKAIIQYGPYTSSTEAIITVNPLGGGDGTPIGFIGYFSSDTAPKGYLICDGAEISRTLYKKLFDVIGTTYGAGDGSTTFNVPNLIDKFPQGSKTVGTVKDPALPNITGAMRFNSQGAFTSTEATSYAKGALGVGAGLEYTLVTSGTTNPWTKNNNGKELALDASKSSSIYKDGATVQPPALTLLPCIKAANVSNVSSADIDVIAALVMDTISKQSINVPKTILTMPSGLSDDGSYYWITNNMLHITINGVKSTNTGEFTIPIPAEYCVPNDRQIIAPAQNYNGSTTYGFLRLVNTGVRFKCFTANQPCWGSIVYMIDNKA